MENFERQTLSPDKTGEELPPLNLPSYEEVLETSKLSSEQFSLSKYEQYITSLRSRIALVKEQEKYLNEQMSQLNRHFGTSNNQSLIAQYEFVQQDINSLSSSITDTTNQSDLFPVDNDWLLLEEQLDTISSKIRDLKFAVANLYTLGGYQAVSVTSSKERQIGIGQQSESDLYSEYARYDLDPRKTEQYFDDLIQKPEGVHSQTLLFGSGMATVTTALTLARNVHPAGTYLFGSQMYFENKNQAERIENELLFQRFELFNESDPSDLAEKMKSDPSVIFAEPIGNSKDLPSVDLKKILETPTTNGQRIIIIDTTLSGPNFDYKKLLEDLDDTSVVILVTSLQKLYQEGDGVASAGIATVISRNSEVQAEVTSKLKAFRGMLGTNITPHNLKLIQKLDPEVVSSYSEAIGKNVTELASGLQQIDSPIVDKVVTGPVNDEGVSTAAVLYLQFKRECGQEFVNRAINIATKRGIQLTDGASFGFKTTRLMVIGGDDYAVRICPGIENPRQLAVMEEIFEETLKEIEARLNRLSKVLN